MAVAIVPQPLVFQELQLAPQPNNTPLQAHLAGGNAYLTRYDRSGEREAGRLGYYDAVVDACYEYTSQLVGLPVGAVLDPTFSKVYVKDALLKYFEDFSGTGDTIQTVAGTVNKVRASATNFRANGASYPRASALLDRDVQLGDIAHVRAVVNGDSYELWTYVSGIEADPVSAVVGVATADDDNAETQLADTDSTYTGDADVVNCVGIDSINGATYDGLEDGDINETYTITVVQGSVGGDATTARLRVTSASGNDDVLSVTPSAFGAPTAIGTRGLTVTWDNSGGPSCSLSASNNGVSDDDFLPGQQWQVLVSQAFTAPTATSGGTYSGDRDMTLLVEVTKGGLYADEPEIVVSSDIGVDFSGPTKVTAAGVAVPVGSFGATIKFDETGLRKGDRYYIPLQSVSAGPYRTLLLGHNLPLEVQQAGATEVDLTLYIRRDVELTPKRYNVTGQYNWTQSDTEVCLKAGATTLDASWTDNGTPQPLTIHSEPSQGWGVVYFHARFWRQDVADIVSFIHDPSQLDAIPGPIDPDNPLKFALSMALQNNNGINVGYTAVSDVADINAWVRVLELLDGRRDVYGLVPLTRDEAVWALYRGHVQAQSSELEGRWRVAWFNHPDVSQKAILTLDADGDEVLATLQDDPNTSGTQYTYLTIPAGNANLVTLGVRAGDVVRYLYTTDGYGDVTHREFVVNTVINESTLRLQTGHVSAVSVPQKIEIWRNLTAAEQAEELALTRGISDRRIRMVWPDTLGGSGFSGFEGFHLCAALAALTGGVVPQQGLTNVTINGFDDLTRTTRLFNQSQLNIAVGGGLWVVTQNPQSGAVYTRQAVTTGDYDDVNQREEMITRNLDSISFYFLDLLSPYIGVSNVTPVLLDALRSEINAGLSDLSNRYYTERLGGQIIEGRLTRLQRHSTLRDRVVARVELGLPAPFNNVELYLVAV